LVLKSKSSAKSEERRRENLDKYTLHEKVMVVNLTRFYSPPKKKKNEKIGRPNKE